MRSVRAPVVALLCVLLAGCGQLPAAHPDITPAVALAAELDDLKVSDEGDRAGYDRDEFPHWSEQGNNCNTRELVLARDGKDVATNDDCYPVAGRWESPYDGGTWTNPQDVDIDHMVPLVEAWESGASAWDRHRRERFANDLDNPQLWAVTDDVNQEKSGQDPAEWKPPIEGFWCEYARAWVQVKAVWGLTVDPAEKEALRLMLNRC